MIIKIYTNITTKTINSEEWETRKVNRIKISDIDKDLKLYTWNIIKPGHNRGTRKTHIPYAIHTVGKFEEEIFSVPEGSMVYMHRLILSRKLGLKYSEMPEWQTDHRNGDSFDNTRWNIRKCTVSQNMLNRPCRNKLGVKHVRINKWGKYEVALTIKDKFTYLGSFETLEEAKIVADDAAKKAHKEFYHE